MIHISTLPGGLPELLLFAWCYLPALTGRYAVWDGDVRAALVAAQTRIAEALGLGAGGDAPAGGDKAML